uniref:OTU domain-containing protein n=2 Tax=Clytia hemisphaerica TaxID=252671 RepID=A0A7M5VBJ9_9CNID
MENRESSGTEPQFPCDDQIVDVPGDGHCLIYAWELCLHASSQNDISYMSLKDMLERELKSNKETYMKFLMKASKIDYDINVLKYIYKKTSNNDLCDILILALSNATSLSCMIWEERNRRFTRAHTIFPISGSSNDRIHVLKRNDHYLAIVDTNNKESSEHISLMHSQRLLKESKAKLSGYENRDQNESEDDDVIIVREVKPLKIDDEIEITKEVPANPENKNRIGNSIKTGYGKKFQGEKKRTTTVLPEPNPIKIEVEIPKEEELSDSELPSFPQPYSPSTYFPEEEEEEETESQEAISETVQPKFQRKIPRIIWEGKSVNEVPNIPYDIDDIKVYHVQSSDGLLPQKLRDGRNWKPDSRTSWAGYKSVRYRECRGGFTCSNPSCPYVKKFGKSNTVSFDKNHYCKFCQASGIYERCEARKYIAYTHNPNEAYVYHYGFHTCVPKEIHQAPISEIVREVQNNPSVRPTEIQTNLILSAIRNRDSWDEIMRTAAQVADTRKISNEKSKQKKVVYPLGENFKGVSDLKEFTDTKDKFLIYDINRNKQYIFKSSMDSLKIAKDMCELDNVLENEYCHFDGNHKRTLNFITLTASTYHPLLKRQVPLASMQCKHEDGETVETFWRVFNKAYKEANSCTNRFEPSGWVTDMATANFNGLSKMYGEDVLEKVKGCEFHYKQSVEKKAKTLGEKGDEFRAKSLELLEAATEEAYTALHRELESFIS